MKETFTDLMGEAMYVVTKDNPYYPSVEYRDTLEEARKLFDMCLEDDHKESGIYTNQVTIAEIIISKTFKSHC